MNNNSTDAFAKFMDSAKSGNVDLSGEVPLEMVNSIDRDFNVFKDTSKIIETYMNKMGEEICIQALKAGKSIPSEDAVSLILVSNASDVLQNIMTQSRIQDAMDKTPGLKALIGKNSPELEKLINDSIPSRAEAMSTLRRDFGKQLFLGRMVSVASNPEEILFKQGGLLKSLNGITLLQDIEIDFFAILRANFTVGDAEADSIVEDFVREVQVIRTKIIRHGDNDEVQMSKVIDAIDRLVDLTRKRKEEDAPLQEGAARLVDEIWYDFKPVLYSEFPEAANYKFDFSNLSKFGKSLSTFLVEQKAHPEAGTSMINKLMEVSRVHMCSELARGR